MKPLVPLQEEMRALSPCPGTRKTEGALTSPWVC